MNVGDVLNGYRILTAPTNAGGGMSRWSFAEKDGAEYFVKMFLAPRYPLPELPGSEEVKARKRATCEAFEQRHLEIGRRIEADASSGSSLVVSRDFFRVGATYVKVMDRVRPDPLPARESLTDAQLLVLLRTLCVGLRVLHRQQIVHADLKPDNVMTQRRGAVYVARLIDFDEAFVAGEPPDPQHVVGDPVFYSPEHLAYLKGMAEGSQLGLAADMFAVGLLFHVLLAGGLPRFDPADATYPCEVLANGGSLGLGPLPPVMLDLVSSLLSPVADDRPTIDDVVTLLLEIDADALSAPARQTTYAPPTVVGPEPADPVPTDEPSAATVPMASVPAMPTPPPARPGPGLRSTLGRRPRPDSPPGTP